MSSLDYLDLCRLCLMKDRVSVPIFEGEGDVRQIFLKIAACLPVKVAREDKLPKKICDDCVYKVELLYQFWNTTANAEKQLLQWLGEVGLEDKQGYVTGVLNPSTMKQEENSSSGLGGTAIQVTGVQPGIGIGVIDNMGLGMPLIIPSSTQQQLTAVPMDTSTGPIQPIQPIQQAVPGPSSQPGHEQIAESQTNATTHQQDEEEETSDDEENSDDDCDGDDGLPVKEESEEDPSNSRTIEPTTFVNVSLACDEAGPSGLQQQKIVEMPEMAMPQTTDGDPKSGFTSLPLSEDYYRMLMLSKLDLVKSEPEKGAQKGENLDETTEKLNGPIKEEIRDANDDEDDMPLAYHCKTCDVFFKTKTLLNNHEIEHKGKRKNTCNQCGRVFRTYVNLRKHMKKHAGSKRNNVGRPMKVKKEKNNVEFLCKTCNKVFGHKSNYQKHLLRHTVGDLTCNHCPKKFRLFRDLTRHEKTHFYPSYMCKECDYETTVLAALSIHMLRHTDKADLPFKCNECDKRFRKAIELQEHYNIHSGDKPFTCATCGSAFYLRRQLSAHCRRMHPEMKANKVTSTACDICGRVLATKRSLFRHKESHNPTKLYLCDYCGKSLSSAEHLKKHRRIHTGEKPYVCDICGKGFTDSENLRMHRRIHTGEKPYKCDQCPKAFSQRSTLTIHRRGHTGERPYVCQICHRGFSCQGNLTAHQKSTCV
ncbi:zinc finger protein 3 homolog isoform X8 [Neodiprion pinetum]|uniref:Endothelial zinc finger protein induced by tumor necrosis factor alpha isoform X4 n=1 Tax=Neodiprion lecontei TaxID=441921 RepID=A0ABM3GAT8_NEOLC|nr:endothelial zinc finger protein induced by tumor necrosis factor alpha-like isoform X4 [Neodiprion pinetum]XP_046597355.1 endothelial zinc finger protein induced by tumor necrosis factor alpha isoform X4 [Neodiprion lecontei]